MKSQACTAVLLSMLALAAPAAELESLEVSRVGSQLHVHSVIFMAAPRELVFTALTDYGSYTELTSRYRESRFIEPAADGTPRIYTLVEGCVLFFCRSLRRYARLETENDERIVARAEPEHSDVHYGLEVWQLERVGENTRVIYSHEMEPRFWVPPAIGVWLIRRELERSALSAAYKIESRARRRGPD